MKNATHGMKEKGNERGDAISEQAASLKGDGQCPKFRNTESEQTD